MLMNESSLQKILDKCNEIRNAQTKAADQVDDSIPGILFAIERNREASQLNRDLIQDINRKLDAIIDHFGINYRPVTFEPKDWNSDNRNNDHRRQA